MPPFGTPFIHVSETDSTNSFLQAWVGEEDVPEGAAVSADYQAKGRGQRGTHWQSTGGENILTSVFLQPHFLKPDEQFWLSKTIALGVLNFVNTLLPQEKVQVKWPNDVYVNGKKIAGILIENTLQGNILRNSIAGIGININQKQNLLPTATSAAQISGSYYDLKHLLPKLYMEMEQMYMLLKSGDRQAIEAFYNKNLFGMEEQLSFINNKTQTTFDGVIKGTTPYGALAINTKSGLQYFDLKEVSLL